MQIETQNNIEEDEEDEEEEDVEEDEIAALAADQPLSLPEEIPQYNKKEDLEQLSFWGRLNKKLTKLQEKCNDEPKKLGKGDSTKYTAIMMKSLAWGFADENHQRIQREEKLE
jgi:threonine synthase